MSEWKLTFYVVTLSPSLFVFFPSQDLWGQWQPVHGNRFMHIITQIRDSNAQTAEVISYAWLILLDVLHLRTLVMYGTNAVGNRAAEWQGQVHADAGGTVWHGQRSEGLTVWRAGLLVQGWWKRGRSGRQRLFLLGQQQLSYLTLHNQKSGNGTVMKI